MPILLSPKTLAAEAEVSVTTLARWRAAGEGPAFVKQGQLIRYPREAVDAWVKANLTA